jgi:hypothetical protein
MISTTVELVVRGVIQLMRTDVSLERVVAVWKYRVLLEQAVVQADVSMWILKDPCVNLTVSVSQGSHVSKHTAHLLGAYLKFVMVTIMTVTGLSIIRTVSHSVNFVPAKRLLFPGAFYHHVSRE